MTPAEDFLKHVPLTVEKFDEKTIFEICALSPQLPGSSVKESFIRRRRGGCKNEPVEQLLEWYVGTDDEKKDYARKSLNDRFFCLSFDQQCDIIRFYMASGIDKDMLTACWHLTCDEYWIDAYLPVVEDLCIRSIDNGEFDTYRAVDVVIKRSSQEFIRKAITEIDRQNMYSKFRSNMFNLLVVCDKQPKEVLENIKLDPYTYADIMLKKGLKISENEAAEVLDLVLSRSYIIRNDINYVAWLMAKFGYEHLLPDFAKRVKEQAQTKTIY